FERFAGPRRAACAARGVYEARNELRVRARAGRRGPANQGKSVACLKYRPSLWQAQGGPATGANRRVLGPRPSVSRVVGRGYRPTKATARANRRVALPQGSSYRTNLNLGRARWALFNLGGFRRTSRVSRRRS